MLILIEHRTIRCGGLYSMLKPRPLGGVMLIGHAIETLRAEAPSMPHLLLPLRQSSLRVADPVIAGVAQRCG
jgi:hypothetical protein